MHSVVFTLGKSVRITVEVVSTNWPDDYLTKLGEYEVLGIQEYWIVDYAALGGRRFMPILLTNQARIWQQKTFFTKQLGMG